MPTLLLIAAIKLAEESMEMFWIEASCSGICLNEFYNNKFLT